MMTQSGNELLRQDAHLVSYFVVYQCVSFKVN